MLKGEKCAKFNYKDGMAIDTQGHIYLAGILNKRIRKMNFE